MTQQSSLTEKFLINCEDGVRNAERAIVKFILAFTASKTSETAMFITGDAAELCVAGGAAAVQCEGYEPLQTLLDGFLGNGGRIWLCPACAKAKGITESDVIPGVEIAGAAKTMAFLAAGGRLLA